MNPNPPLTLEFKERYPVLVSSMMESEFDFACRVRFFVSQQKIDVLAEFRLCRGIVVRATDNSAKIYDSIMWQQRREDEMRRGISNWDGWD